MSSQLNQMVPVLTGINYKDWALRMEAYLKIVNFWGYVSGSIPRPAMPPPPASTATMAAAVSAHNHWADHNGHVMGIIYLKTAPRVRVRKRTAQEAIGLP